jgi:O-antigen ligase
MESMPSGPSAAATRFNRRLAAVKRPAWVWALLAAFCGLAGLGWLLPPRADTPRPAATRVTALTPGSVATLDSPVFQYSPGWQVTVDGADPSEPAAPWQMPAGTLDFAYTGSELALQVAMGDYWGYLFVTVDGQPANRLAVIRGNHNSHGQPAGYRTFYAPEAQTASGPAPQWVVVHRAATPGPHAVSVEVWRSWGQTPLRAAAVDALPAARPTWPGVALLVAGGWTALAGLWGLRLPQSVPQMAAPLRAGLDVLLRPPARLPVRWSAAVVALALLAVAVALKLWWLTWPSLAILGYAALAQPSLWLAGLLLALPFYFSQTLPILPGRATNLIEVSLLGGLPVIALHRVLAAPQAKPPGHAVPAARWLGWLLAALVSWALVATFAAEHTAPALREWRTLFWAGAIFALLLHWVLDLGTPRDRDLLVAAWIAGATLTAAIGLWQAAAGVMLIDAEGVQRVRAFYGSPNNLALYLERTLMVTLGFVLLAEGQLRWVAAGASALQAAALLLTFSKGSLLLGVPAGLLVLWLGGWWTLTARGESRRPLWWIAATAALGCLALLPFLSADRFRGLLDFSQGTGYLRLLLWRSAWQMGLDHPWLGVGPDNFLYVFRSGYLLPGGWQEPNLNHPHNWPLDWWTRLGLPGLALGTTFFLGGCTLLWSCLRAHLRGTATEAALWLGLLAASVAALVHGLIDLSYATPDLMLVWVLIFFTARSCRYLLPG